MNFEVSKIKNLFDFPMKNDQGNFYMQATKVMAHDSSILNEPGNNHTSAKIRKDASKKVRKGLQSVRESTERVRNKLNPSLSNSTHEPPPPKAVPLRMKMLFFFLNHLSTIIIVFAVVIILVGGVGNSLVIAVVFKNSNQLTSTTNTFIVNLAIADLSFLLLCIPFHAYILTNGKWLFGNFLCATVHFLQYSSMAASVWTLVAVSLDRFFAVAYPLQTEHLRKPRFALLLCFFIWIVSFLLSAPTLFVFKVATINIGGYRRLKNDSASIDAADFNNSSFNNSVPQQSKGFLWSSKKPTNHRLSRSLIQSTCERHAGSNGTGGNIDQTSPQTASGITPSWTYPSPFPPPSSFLSSSHFSTSKSLSLISFYAYRPKVSATASTMKPHQIKTTFLAEKISYSVSLFNQQITARRSNYNSKNHHRSHESRERKACEKSKIFGRINNPKSFQTNQIAEVRESNYVPNFKSLPLKSQTNNPLGEEPPAMKIDYPDVSKLSEALSEKSYADKIEKNEIKNAYEWKDKKAGKENDYSCQEGGCVNKEKIFHRQNKSTDAKKADKKNNNLKVKFNQRLFSRNIKVLHVTPHEQSHSPSKLPDSFHSSGSYAQQPPLMPLSTSSLFRLFPSSSHSSNKLSFSTPLSKSPLSSTFLSTTLLPMPLPSMPLRSRRAQTHVTQQCMETWQGNKGTYYSLLFLFTYVIPLSNIACFSAGTIHRLWANPNVNSRVPSRSLMAKRRSSKLIISVVVLFSVCWLPAHILWLVVGFVKVDKRHAVTLFCCK